MSQERFDALLGRLADAVGRDQVPLLRQEGLLSVAGADVLIRYVPDRLCRLLVDMGPVAAHADASYFRRMLELNLGQRPEGWPVLSLHPENGHVVAILDAALEDLEEGAALLILLSLRVPAWIDAWRDELGGPMAPARSRASTPTVLATTGMLA